MHKWNFPCFETVTQDTSHVEKDEEFNKGYQAGYQAGYQEGLQRGNEETQIKVLSFDRLIKELTHKKESIIKKMDETCFLVLKKICKHVLYKELSMSEEVILSIVKKALELLGVNEHEGRIHLLCSKTLFLLLKRCTHEYPTLFLEENETLQEFDFIIESPVQRVDFKFEKALARLFDYAE